MGVIISTDLASALADATAAAIDADAAAGTIEVYDGPLPADVASAGSDTFLLSISLAYPCMTGPPTDGVADFNVSGPLTGTVLADGVPGYFIIWSNGGTAIQIGKVGVAGDPDADVITDGTGTPNPWVTGELVEIGASTLTMPTSG